MNININLLDPLAEAMAIALKTGVSISRHYDFTRNSVVTFQVDAKVSTLAKVFPLAAGLSDKKEVEQKFTFCCWLAALMSNPEAQPQPSYQEALSQLTGGKPPRKDLDTIKLIDVFNMLHALTGRLDKRPTLELSYWQERQRHRPGLNDRSKVAHLRPVEKLKFGTEVFEISFTDEDRALEAMFKCLDTVLIEIGKDWVKMAHTAFNSFQENARDHMGPEDEENRVLDTF